MSSGYLKIAGGAVYDPVHGVNGERRDIWIRDGKIVAPPSDQDVRPDRTIDASGLVVMPGGVDMHCHIAGPKVNSARKMRPEDKRKAEKIVHTAVTRSGTMGSVPSTFATGYKYAGMGYTTAFDAAIPPLAARHVHEEFEDTPCIDKGFFVLMGNNHFVMQSIQRNEPERLRSFMAWLLGAAKGYTPKVVNPGGVEVWKQLPSGNVRGLDENVAHFDVTPRQIIEQIARAVDELRLPHSLHLHANNLGMPGNWRITLETMKTFGHSRGHLAHIQFHSYGGGEGDETTFNSKVPDLVEYVDSHPNLTVDVGQVLFGETTTMTADGPLGYYLSNAFKTKWFSSETEMESGCGIAPIEYKNTSLVHSLQWAIGLEWYLLAKDPWRVVMSTDHPNGGSFLAYPQIIHMLMDRTHRQDMLKRVHPAVLERSTLGDLTREYSLYEICIITRSGPARILGLQNKGHLGPGADADITIYTPDDDKTTMFEMPRTVVKSGVVIVDQGEVREPLIGKLLYVAPEYDAGIETDIAEWFEKYYSVRFRNYPVSLDYLHDHEEVATGVR